MSLIESLIDAVSENLKTLLVVGAATSQPSRPAFRASATRLSHPHPGGHRSAPVLVGAVVVVGWVVGGKLADLLPDPNGHYGNRSGTGATSRAARFGS